MEKRITSDKHLINFLCACKAGAVFLSVPGTGAKLSVHKIFFFIFSWCTLDSDHDVEDGV
jgi:hypothetical protein